MQHGLVDLVIVGSDRTTSSGDVANKIGTYLKALAAHDNNIPFYVALPSSTFDWTIHDGISEIPIEERDPGEVEFMAGWQQEDKAVVSSADHADRQPDQQLRLRRNPGAAGHRLDHRARHLRRQRKEYSCALP